MFSDSIRPPIERPFRKAMRLPVASEREVTVFVIWFGERDVKVGDITLAEIVLPNSRHWLNDSEAGPRLRAIRWYCPAARPWYCLFSSVWRARSAGPALGEAVAVPAGTKHAAIAKSPIAIEPNTSPVRRLRRSVWCAVQGARSVLVSII